jgi:hypothetical protein
MFLACCLGGDQHPQHDMTACGGGGSDDKPATPTTPPAKAAAAVANSGFLDITPSSSLKLKWDRPSFATRAADVNPTAVRVQQVRQQRTRFRPSSLLQPVPERLAHLFATGPRSDSRTVDRFYASETSMVVSPNLTQLGDSYFLTTSAISTRPSTSQPDRSKRPYAFVTMMSALISP